MYVANQVKVNDEGVEGCHFPVNCSYFSSIVCDNFREEFNII